MWQGRLFLIGADQMRLIRAALTHHCRATVPCLRQQYARKELVAGLKQRVLKSSLDGQLRARHPCVSPASKRKKWLNSEREHVEHTFCGAGNIPSLFSRFECRFSLWCGLHAGQMKGCTAGTFCNSSPAVSSCLHFAPAALCGRLTPELPLEHAGASGAGAAGDCTSETGSSGHPAPAVRRKRRREEEARARAADTPVQQWPAQRMHFPDGADLADCAQSAHAAPWAQDPDPGPAWGGLWSSLESAAARSPCGRCPEWRALLAAATSAGAPGGSGESGSCASAFGGGGGHQPSSYYAGAPLLEGPGMYGAVTTHVQVWPKPVCS